jgi:hypothetical protein
VPPRPAPPRINFEALPAPPTMSIATTGDTSYKKKGTQPSALGSGHRGRCAQHDPGYTAGKKNTSRAVAFVAGAWVCRVTTACAAGARGDCAGAAMTDARVRMPSGPMPVARYAVRRRAVNGAAAPASVGNNRVGNVRQPALPLCSKPACSIQRSSPGFEGIRTRRNKATMNRQ